MKALRQNASHKSHNSGQALLELLISLAVLILVIVALISTVNFSISTIAVSRNKSASITYAQEGIEFAKQQHLIDWNALSTPSSWPTDPNGAIAGTPFTRTVTVTDIAAGQKEIEVSVTWESGGRSHETILATVMTDWR